MESGGNVQRIGQSEDQEDRVSRPNAIARAFLSFDSPHCFLSSLDSADDSLLASIDIKNPQTHPRSILLGLGNPNPNLFFADQGRTRGLNHY